MNPKKIHYKTIVLSTILALVATGAVYYVVSEQPQPQDEKDKRETILAQQERKSLEEIFGTGKPEDDQAIQADEIEKLRKEIEEIKAKQAQEIPVKTIGGDQISVSELSEYLTGVVKITCFNSSGKTISTGSGSLWNFPGTLGYAVLTNRHVITSDQCHAYAPSTSEDETIGIYWLDVENATAWNNDTDIRVLKITSPVGGFPSSPISVLNYRVSTLRKCTPEIAQNSSVVVIGYPSFAESRIVTNGVVSGYDDSVQYPFGNLPYPNLFVSAKIDSGNSGGIALAKEGNNLCLLGVPTWLSVGNYETQGLIQNIHNVLYQE